MHVHCETECTLKGLCVCKMVTSLPSQRSNLPSLTTTKKGPTPREFSDFSFCDMSPLDFLITFITNIIRNKSMNN